MRTPHTSVRRSVRPSLCPSKAKKSHYQSRKFVGVSNCRADAVDRLLIYVNIYLVLWRSLSDLLGDLHIALFNFKWQIHEENSSVCYTNFVLIYIALLGSLNNIYTENLIIRNNNTRNNMPFFPNDTSIFAILDIFIIIL